ncbi:chemotaxis protein MotB [Chitinophaga niastensis]|uniref:Chemotaxis protein MotB n=1 Tax=Chitinophaga niastensis TaxID=536980 RepID=A0A2P8HIL9_CHINA|nr:OmpA family protein [Chitinophaga niastensis]PSL46057.1 chemotaxis protein MotB [Chitinophaga niastensis]
MRIERLALPVALVTIFASCSAPRKLRESQVRNAQLDSLYRNASGQLRKCEEDAARNAASYKDKVESLQEQQTQLKSNNSQMLDHLKELSVISSSQAESIKKSLDNIGAKDAYIKDLQSAIARKDSLNMQLVMNLKGAIGNMDDKDINIKVDKGVVYIDISDKLLFKSGSYDINERAKEVLGKVAKVLINQPDIEFMVEGHTDNVPYRPNVLLDNWDLSVKRATSVVRILQNQYNIPPARMTAAGRSEYLPVASNDTPEGRAANRRTRIVILPQLDQFFKLLEKPAN